MGIAKAVRHSRELRDEVLTQIEDLKPLRNKSGVLSTFYHIGLLIILAEILFNSNRKDLEVNYQEIVMREIYKSSIFSAQRYRRSVYRFRVPDK